MSSWVLNSSKAGGSTSLSNPFPSLVNLILKTNNKVLSYAQEINIFQVVITAFWPASRNHWEEPASTFFTPLPQVFTDGEDPPVPSPGCSPSSLSLSSYGRELLCRHTHTHVQEKKNKVRYSGAWTEFSKPWDEEHPWVGHETKPYDQHGPLLLATGSSEFWFAGRENI